jgi:antitoxin PrlF
MRCTEIPNRRESLAIQENLAVSAREQITLPAALRKRFGIHRGDVVIVQDRGGEIVLKPAAVLEIDTYTDEQIAQWDEQDRLAPEERRAILQRLGVER